MPKKNNHTAISPGTRPSTRRRNFRQKPAGETPRGRRSTQDGAIIADSLFALRLKVIPGTEVFFVHENLEDPDNGEMLSLQLLHEDLLAIASNMRAVIKGDPIKVDLTDKGLEVSTAVAWNLEQIRRLIPKDFEFNIEYGHIEKHGDGHFIMVYKECAWQPNFLVFPIGNLLMRLRRQNKQLHDLFLSFFRSFTQSTGINLWWQGFAGHSFSVFKERYDDMYEELTEEQRADWLKDLNNYQGKEGNAFRYQRLIIHAPLLDGPELARRAMRFQNPLASIITYGAQLMDGTNYYKDFTYYPQGNTDDVYHLEQDGQQAFVWDIEDNFFADFEQDVDATAHEGVQIPVISMEISHKRKEFDFLSLRQKMDWPNKLVLFFNHANNTLNEYERKNGSADKKV